MKSHILLAKGKRVLKLRLKVTIANIRALLHLRTCFSRTCFLILLTVCLTLPCGNLKNPNEYTKPYPFTTTEVKTL